MNGALADSEWSKIVPVGTTWTGVIQEDDADEVPAVKVAPQHRPKAQKAKTNAKKTKLATENETEKSEPFTGDCVLANSITFMRDTLLSREVASAAAAGDVGRFWEILKVSTTTTFRIGSHHVEQVMLFHFCGSSHSKYATYLLETVADLELESSLALKEQLLSFMLVSLNGRDFMPGDLLQEHFNRLLKAIVKHKGKDFQAPFIREISCTSLDT